MRCISIHSQFPSVFYIIIHISTINNWIQSIHKVYVSKVPFYLERYLYVMASFFYDTQKEKVSARVSRTFNRGEVGKQWIPDAQIVSSRSLSPAACCNTFFGSLFVEQYHQKTLQVSIPGQGQFPHPPAFGAAKARLDARKKCWRSGGWKEDRLLSSLTFLWDDQQSAYIVATDTKPRRREEERNCIGLL